MRNFQLELLYIALATVGGIARYLTAYESSGKKFAFRYLLTSAFISGFSGYMFALLGVSMGMPQPFLYMMAGVGGFMGEQALKFLSEYVTQKMK